MQHQNIAIQSEENSNQNYNKKYKKHPAFKPINLTEKYNYKKHN